MRGNEADFVALAFDVEMGIAGTLTETAMSGVDVYRMVKRLGQPTNIDQAIIRVAPVWTLLVLPRQAVPRKPFVRK